MRQILFFLILTLLTCCSTPSEFYEEKTVYVAKTTEGFTLMRNSLPFKIKGAAGSPDHIESLAQAGANTIRVYDTTDLKTVLDKALAHNLAVAVDIPMANYQSTFYQSQANRDSAFIRIKKLVEGHKDHPALLFWMLGNELQFPTDYFLNSRQLSFIAFFNTLLKQIHELDPNHPVSTSIASISKKRIFSIQRRSPNLDFISINIFGQIHEMDSQISKLSLFWDGPFLISEWGAEGPWINRKTNWNSTIELTDGEKAKEIEKVYTQYLDAYPSRNLGDLVFYWGEKQETTHTWFSLLDSQGRKSNMANSVAQYFQGPNTMLNRPPLIENMLLNSQKSWSDIIIEPNTICKAKVEYKASDSLDIHWEIVKEGWNVEPGKKEIKPTTYALTKGLEKITFKAPENEGPYRLFVYLYDTNQNFTTANIPFYVLR